MTRCLSRLLVVSALVCSTSGSLPAQDFLDPVNGDPKSYIAPPLSGHCKQTYRLFLPPAPHVMPADGWPVLVSVSLLGYSRSQDTPQLAPGSLLYKIAEQGVAVITARVTPSIDVNDPKWIDACGMPPDLPGHGLFHPPGFVPPDLAAQGIAPYEDTRYHMAEKDCVMLLQHVRYRARQTAGFQGDFEEVMADLDHRRIAVHGVSAAAMSLMWATLGPDRSGELPFAGLPGQYAEPTRPDVAVFVDGVTWWPVLADALSLPVSHFGAGGHSEIAATSLGEIDVQELYGSSAFAYRDTAANSQLPLYLSYGEVSHSTSYKLRTSNCGPYPICFNDQGQEGLAGGSVPYPNLHAAWNGYAWIWNHLLDPIRLVITDEDAYAQRKTLPAVPLYPSPGQSMEDALDEQWDDIAVWVRTELDNLLPDLPTDPWHTLGDGLAGTDGVPRLTGSGPLLAGTNFTVELTDARPSTPLVAFLGFQQVSVPLLGGILLPSPDRMVFSFATDLAGELSLSSTWPAGVPGGTQLFLQFWVPDPVAPQGYATSNAVQLDAP